jgi:hypothetical protein
LMRHCASSSISERCAVATDENNWGAAQYGVYW